MNLFQRILVPLDGSLRAERALPLAARIARVSRGSLILLRVVEEIPEKNAGVTLTSSLESRRMQAQLDEAQRYLTVLTQSREIADIPFTIIIQTGPVIPTIMSRVQSSQADLLVLCESPCLGEQTLSSDSMVEQCLEQTSIPLLLVPPHGEVLHRQRHPFTLLLASDQPQPEQSLLEPAITLLTTLAVCDQDQPLGNVACTLRAFPAAFRVLNPLGVQKDTNVGLHDRRQRPFMGASLTGNQHKGSPETRENRGEGDVLVLGMSPQPERERWIHNHRKDSAFSAWSLPVLFVPLSSKSLVGAPR